MSASCIYTGTIRHRRREPRNEFRHPLALAYLDLDELPTLLGGRLVRRRPGALRLRRRDCLRPGSVPLRDAVAALVQERTGKRPEGPIRLLTQLRSFGICFNPVSFYYCLDAAGERLEAVVAEVTNTPWGERHAYVVAASPGRSGVLEAGFTKALHVSPFMGMDQQYLARFTDPGETLSVHIENHAGGGRDADTVFDATLALRRRPLTRRSAAWLAARYPFASLRVLALIYGHAIGLVRKRARLHAHPKAVRA